MARGFERIVTLKCSSEPLNPETTFWYFPDCGNFEVGNRPSSMDLFRLFKVLVVQIE